MDTCAVNMWICGHVWWIQEVGTARGHWAGFNEIVDMKSGHWAGFNEIVDMKSGHWSGYPDQKVI